MTYKSSFYFIADCLQLKVTTSTRLGLISQIENGKVNWEDVVRIASSHLVLPLLILLKLNFLFLIERLMTFYRLNNFFEGKYYETYFFSSILLSK